MAFKMAGFSAFTKSGDQDTPSGRTKLEELKNDLLEIDKSIERHSDKPHIIVKLKKSKKEIEVAIAKLQ